MAASSLQNVSRPPDGLAVGCPEAARVEPKGKVKWFAQFSATQVGIQRSKYATVMACPTPLTVAPDTEIRSI